MIFHALSKLPINKRKKPIYVISNDTLVENPVIQKHIDRELCKIRAAGKQILFPHNPNLFVVKKTTPSIKDTFWVNLIANGYPAPNKWFRWCTQRMKINPTSEYITKHKILSKSVILVLGTRKAESTDRAKSMKKYENANGSKLSKHSLPNSYVYAPLADFSNDDVWTYLLQVPNFWGSNNKDLLTLYRNASGECPLVVESGTASCGNSRFGCWVCTVVRKDKSMENLIENGEEWMEAMLNFRNWLVDISQQDNQKIPDSYNQKISYGPLLLKTRKAIFEELLNLQRTTNQNLISQEEVDYINLVFRKDSKTEITDGLYQWDVLLKNQKSISLIADYNPLKSNRKRIGNMSITAAEIINSKKISALDFNECEKLTRVFYY
jgi:DNA sulfur modification protein DndC